MQVAEQTLRRRKIHATTNPVDGVLPSQPIDYDHTTPEALRTESPVQRMVQIMSRAQIEPTRYKVDFKHSFVFLVT